MITVKQKAVNPYKNRHTYWLCDCDCGKTNILIDGEMLESVDENYRYAETFSDALINQIHFLLKEVKIHSRKEVYDLLSKDSLKRIAARLKF